MSNRGSQPRVQRREGMPRRQMVGGARCRARWSPRRGRRKRIRQGEIESAGVAGAVSKAIKGVYKRYPVLGAPVSLDMKLFDDGGTTLGDRITSDAFYF